jgi:hypothetical protein
LELKISNRIYADVHVSEFLEASNGRRKSTMIEWIETYNPLKGYSFIGSDAKKCGDGSTPLKLADSSNAP